MIHESEAQLRKAEPSEYSKPLEPALHIFRSNVCPLKIQLSIRLGTSDERKPYPSDGTDAEWNFWVPYLTLMKADAPQRQHALRELCNGRRWLARTGSEWRMLPHDLPPWHAVYQ